MLIVVIIKIDGPFPWYFMGFVLFRLHHFVVIIRSLGRLDKESLRIVFTKLRQWSNSLLSTVCSQILPFNEVQRFHRKWDGNLFVATNFKLRKANKIQFSKGCFVLHSDVSNYRIMNGHTL